MQHNFSCWYPCSAVFTIMLPRLCCVVLIFIFGICVVDSLFENPTSETTPKSQQSQEDTLHPICVPHSPKVNCSYLPIEFLDCKEPKDHEGNGTTYETDGHGCRKFGGQRYEHVEHAKVQCTVLPGIECCGKRTFFRDGIPCIRYSGHYFCTTLIYSVLLGFLGMDRFCLGQTGTAVGKLLTMGGVGIWWIVDIVLLITGSLMPEDGSNWNSNV